MPGRRKVDLREIGFMILWLNIAEIPIVEIRRGEPENITLSALCTTSGICLLALSIWKLTDQFSVTPWTLVRVLMLLLGKKIIDVLIETIFMAVGAITWCVALLYFFNWLLALIFLVFLALCCQWWGGLARDQYYPSLVVQAFCASYIWPCLHISCTF